MSEENVSYGKEPIQDEFHIGDLIWVEDHSSKLYRNGKITEIKGDYLYFETHTGDKYSTQKKYAKVLGTNYKKPIPYEVSYIADKPKASLEGQVGGEHYKNLVIQPVEYCFRNNIPAIESSIIRYATRHRDKNKAQDVEKIIHYAKILLQLEYNYTDEQIAGL